MISVTILTNNSEDCLEKVLDSVRFFDEVVILDSGSTDKTLEIASAYSNVVIYEGGFIGFGPQHNKAAELASNDWILSLDSDEVLSSELAREIMMLQLDPNCIYSFPFHNYYNDKWIKCCGWYPDRHVRLYNQTSTKFSDAYVHEKIISKGFKEVKLAGYVNHYSYRKVGDFLRKMQSYSDLFAEQNQGKRKGGICKAALHGLFAFFKNYILQRGIFSGAEGLIISIYNANTAFYKYLKLQEANKNASDLDVS